MPRPSTPLVLYSGIVVLEDPRRLAEECRAAAMLLKPFALAQPVEAIREAIAQRSDPGQAR